VENNFFSNIILKKYGLSFKFEDLIDELFLLGVEVEKYEKNYFRIFLKKTYNETFIYKLYPQKPIDCLFILDLMFCQCSNLLKKIWQNID
jgi:hypothetical protein